MLGGRGHASEEPTRRLGQVIGLTLLVLGAAWALCRSGAPTPGRGPDDARAPTSTQSRPWEEPLHHPPGGLAGGAAISGTVRDVEGRPIAVAQVCAVAHASRLLDAGLVREPRCALTEADGRYRLEGLWGAPHTVSAGAPGYVPAFYRRVGGPEPLDPVALRPGAAARGIDLILQGGAVELRGVVKDLSGGTIEGAWVRSGGMFYGTGIAYGRTGPDGEFSLWVRPGQPRVSAQAEGYAGGSDSGVVPGHHFEIFMTPEAVLVGKVVGASDGSPVADAAVSADRGDHFAGTGTGTTRTDASGNFRLDQLMPGAYKPRADADDGHGVAREQTILSLGETSAPIVIEMHPAVVVEGRVFVAGGSSCERGSVALRDPARASEPGAAIEADGLAHVAGVLPGTYEVSVRCDGFVSAERYDPVVVAAADVTGLRWEVARGQSIRGLVVSAKGEPVAGINLSARTRADPAVARARSTGAYGAFSDGEGRFTLAALLPGTYEVRAYSVTSSRALPETPLTVTLPEGRDVEGVRVELPPTGEVRGEVRDARGSGVARTKVTLTSPRRQRSATTADDGSFLLREIEAGEYRAVATRDGVQLRAPGTGDDDTQGVPVAVQVDSVATVHLVVETASGRLSGVVRDEGGAPAPDVFIETTRESERASAAAGSGAATSPHFLGGRGRPILTDSDGRFVAEGLVPGKYTVRAFRRGGGEALAEHVPIGEDLVLTIAPTGRLAGIVVAPGGGAPDEFSVLVVEPVKGYRRTDTFFRTGGAWSFGELPAGSYNLQVTAGEGTRAVDLSLGPGEERTGLRVELAAKVTLRGRVVGLGDEPVPGIEVMVSESGSFRFDPESRDRRHISDATGHFEITRAPVGQVVVRAFAASGVTSEFVGASFVARIDGPGPVVELPPIRLAARRVAPGEVQGDLGYQLRSPDPGADPLKPRLIVGFVRPAGPAAAAGLRVGDEITAVNGRDVTGASGYLHNALIQVGVGGVVRLELTRGTSVELIAAVPP